MARQRSPAPKSPVRQSSTHNLPVPGPTAPTRIPRPPFQRPRPRRVAKGSFFDIMRSNPGCSLFVRPLCWTDRHTQLLGVNFNQLPPCDTPVPVHKPGSKPSRGHMRPSRAIKTLSSTLTNVVSRIDLHPLAVSNLMRTIMATLWPDAFNHTHCAPPVLHLYFGGRVYLEAVRVQALWNFPSTSSCLSSSQHSLLSSTSTQIADTDHAGPPSLSSSSSSSSSSSRPDEQLLLQGRPMVGYLSKTHLASVRRAIFRVVRGPSGQYNAPVSRLQQLRTRSMIPEDADKDSYIASVMIAMAQKHFYTDYRVRSMLRKSVSLAADAKPFRDLKMRLISHDEKTADFIVYTGHVTAAFLERFRHPHKTPPCTEHGGRVNNLGLEIDYVRVPVWPILGLRERLGKALGEEVVGVFDANVMETWEEEEEAKEVGVDRSSSSGGSRKRKRAAAAAAALNPILGGNFEEQPGQDEAPPIRKKMRRIRKGPPPEVVV